MKLGDIFVALNADDRDFDKGLKRAEGKARAFTNIMQGLFQGAGQAIFFSLTDGIRNGVGAAISTINEATNAASDLNETVNKTAVVFGQSADDVLAWSRATDQALGQSQQTALSAAASFGNLFTSLGTTRDEAANMSVGLVELASDLASFNNIDPTEALEKLRAGIVGETEPLRTLGVFLNETVVQAKAAELGFGAVGTKLTEQQKVLARYALIMEQSANAQGDFARTSDDLANAQRRLAAQFANAQSSLGQAFLPIKTAFVRGLSDLITTIQPYGQNIIASLARGMARGIAFITPVLMQIRRLITSWLRPGSPPKLLPDLVKWGQAAAQEWLGGWGKADFAGLDALGKSVETIIRSFVDVGNIKDTDLFSRVFGSREAIQAAINEFRTAGQVSKATIDRIAASAGEAGESLSTLIESYFELASASEDVRRAQDNLNRVTAEYDAIISPLTGRLGEVRAEQQRLRDQQRLAQLQLTLNSVESTAFERRQAALEIEEIGLQQQIDAAEQSQEAAIDNAQAQLDAAEAAEQAAQAAFDVAQATINQQVEYNTLLSEQVALQQRLAAEEQARREELEAAEKARRQEAEAAAKAAAAEAEAVHQAQLQYQLGLADTQGKLALLRTELGRTQTGSVEYFGLLGQIAALETQTADEAQQKASLLADAQLDYRLQLATTQGKLDIFNEILGQTQEGSVEWFETLSKIAQLKEQLANEAAGGGIDIGLPEVPEFEGSIISADDVIDPELKSAVDEVTRAIDLLFASLSGADDQLNASLPESMQATGGGENWATKLLADFQEIKRNVGEIMLLAGELNSAFNPNLTPLENLKSTLRTVVDLLKGDFKAAWQEAFTFPAESEGSDAYNAGRAVAGMIGDGFKAAWGGTAAFFLLAFKGIADLLPGSEPKDTSSPFYGLGARGAAIITNIIDGAKAKWDELFPWWGDIWQKIRDLLPGSEPVDGSSPLSNLGKAGEGILTNLWDGLKLKWIEVLAWWKTELLHFPQRISDHLTAIFTAGVLLFTSLWNGVKLKWKEIYDWWAGPEGVLTTFTEAISDIDLLASGKAIIDSLFEGLKEGWRTLDEWLTSKSGILQGFRDLWPFSEPKDPSSPLRGLGKAGESLIGNVQAGMERASAGLSQTVGVLRGPALDAAATTNNHNMGPITVSININGNADGPTVRRAAEDGVKQTLRAMGYA